MRLSVRCPRCGQGNVFDQPYRYRAGFGDQGFMYSDSGHCTLVWSCFDPVLEQFFPAGRGGLADLASRTRFEEALRPAPDGGRWKFTNPAKCWHCPEAIAVSILQQIHYLVYPGSIITDEGAQFMLVAQLQINSTPQ